ncbi:MAG: hypothetical protein P8N43_16220, partial [Alphaproteobacteria bacterium]|nr:hypothetical protein [Alphaproteobacteria bacterium]
MSIKADTVTIKCKLSFMHFVKPDDFKGTLKYKFRLTNLSDAAVAALNDRFGEDAGMGHKRVKFDEKYPDAGQYASFTSNYPIKVKVDKEDVIVGGKDGNGADVAKVIDPRGDAIGYGSEAIVRVFADRNGNPRVSFVDITELVSYDNEGDDD